MFLPQGLAAAHVKAAFLDGQFASTQALAVKAYARTLRQETLLLGTCQGVCLPLLGLPLTRPEGWPCQQTLRNRWRVVPGGTLRPSFCFAQGEGELLALAAANRLVDFTAWGVLEDKCRLHELLMVGGQVGGRNLHVHGQSLLWCCHTQRGRPGQPLKHHLQNMSCLMDAWRWQATLDQRRLRLCWPRSFAVPKQAAAAARAFLTSSGRLGLEADRKVWGTLLLSPVVARSGVTRLKKNPILVDIQLGERWHNFILVLSSPALTHVNGIVPTTSTLVSHVDFAHRVPIQNTCPSTVIAKHCRRLTWGQGQCRDSSS